MSNIPKKWQKHMSPERAAALRLELAARTDWFGTCRWCKERLEGSLADLRAHNCKEGSSDKKSS